MSSAASELVSRSGLTGVAAGVHLRALSASGSTAGQILDAASPISTGTAAAHLLSITTGGSFTLAAGLGAFTLAGQDVALGLVRRLVADAGAFTLAGQDVGLLAARRLGADPGAFTLAGQDVGLLAARRLGAGAGAFALAGQDVALFLLLPSLPPDGRVLAVTTEGRLVLLEALPRDLAVSTHGRLVLLEALPRELAVRAAGRIIRVPAVF